MGEPEAARAARSGGNLSTGMDITTLTIMETVSAPSRSSTGLQTSALSSMVTQWSSSHPSSFPLLKTSTREAFSPTPLQ